MARKELSPLAAELVRTIKEIGPCTGLDAWADIGRRISVARSLGRDDMRPDIGEIKEIGVDCFGVAQIYRSDLDAALLEAETAGALGCRNPHKSGATEEYSWRPLPPESPVERQSTLF